MESFHVLVPLQPYPGLAVLSCCTSFFLPVFTIKPYTIPPIMLPKPLRYGLVCDG
jgi:hypothetical protein